MRRLLIFALLALAASSGYAQDKISSFPAASAQTGSEQIPEVQGGANVNTTPAQIATYDGSHINIAALSQLPSQATSTILCNNSGSSAAPTACNPLAVANILSAVISVTAVSTTNITLSGTGTPVDGVSLVAGLPILVAGQTTASQNGIYITSTGAWTRAVNFPSGYVISLNCQLEVFIAAGTAHQGHTFTLTTSGGAITIGTTAQTWTDSLIGPARPTSPGTVWSTTAANSGSPATLLIGTALANDCVTFQDNSGDVADFQIGACAFADATFHYSAAQAGLQLTLPTVTGTGCSLVTGSSDGSGAITATGADTCTLTFGQAFTTNAPFCGLGGEGTTVLPTISTRPTKTAVIFHTAAAGTFEYVCM